jgi:hypothetical protein
MSGCWAWRRSCRSSSWPCPFGLLRSAPAAGAAVVALALAGHLYVRQTLIATVLGGVASLTVTGLWAWLFPSLRRVDRLE